MENIATAPSSRAERVAGIWVAIAASVAFIVLLPFGGRLLPAVAAFVPAAVGAAVLAQFLTALLFYVQYRIDRSSQLALLALAYASSTILSLFYILTFPQVFAATGLFNATIQTAPWINSIERLLFGAFVIAIVLADRFAIRLRRRTVRAIALVTGLALIAILYASLQALPPLLTASARPTALYFDVVLLLEVLLYGVALALLLASRLQTVTQVWLAVVLLVRTLDVASSGLLSGGRFTAFWYIGRVAFVVASSVLLAVFLVKINDLLLRLARRNSALAERTEVAELEIAEGELRYRSLANVVPQLIWSATADGNVDYVNDRWIAYTGLNARETREAGWRAALATAPSASNDDGWDASMRTGAAFSGEFRLRERQNGRSRWFLIDAVAIRDVAGEIARWIGSCTDIDRQKRIEEREAFLAGAGDRLSASLDMNATLGTIADLVIGRMAVWARVDLLDDDGRFVTATVASSLRPEERALRGLVGSVAGGRLENLFVAALARREPIVESNRPELAGDLPAVRAGIALIVPLTSGDTFLGTLTLVRDEPELPDADELAVARDFGRRAAQALDHARLYERERSTADALQRAMLPSGMPQLPNVAFSASYSAASESQRVGGDFYDAFTLPDGRVALTIGDVTGHGLEAAVIMGEIRQALRAASFERAEPATILDRASTLLVASGRSVFVTAVFGVLDTQTGVFEYATAGHPAPLLYDGVQLTRLATSGLPIGLRDDEGVDFSLTLPPHSTLVLYTDGLLEFSRDLDEGERRVEAAIRELDTTVGERLAGSIMQRVLRDDAPTDDIAILTATLHHFPAQAPYEAREWRFTSSDALTATHVRHEIGALVAAWTGRDDASYEGELVFGELFSNVVRHAPGRVHARVAATVDGAEIVVSDTGAGFIARAGSTEELAESGRGLELVRAFSDAVRIEAGDPAGTRVSVAFYVDAAANNDGKNAALKSA